MFFSHFLNLQVCQPSSGLCSQLCLTFDHLAFSQRGTAARRPEVKALLDMFMKTARGSRALFVCLVTREETRDRIPVINERRERSWKEGLSGSLRSVSIRLCFRGVNGFAGHSPSRSAEVVAAWRCGRVAAEAALKLLFRIYLGSTFDPCCWLVICI